MLVIDTEELLRKNPFLEGDVLNSVIKWIDANCCGLPSGLCQTNLEQQSYIDPNIITQQITNIPAVEVLGALLILERNKIIGHTYKMVAPTNHLVTEGMYRSIDEIPDTLFDTSKVSFSKKDGSIKSVYVIPPL